MKKIAGKKKGDDKPEHSSTFKKSALANDHPPPPKKAKESESNTEIVLGIFPDIPDALLKKEFDEVTNFNSSDGMDKNSIYITAESDASATEHLHVKLEIKEEENEGLLGNEPIIKTEVFPDCNYILNEEECEDHETVVQSISPEEDIDFSNCSHCRYVCRLRDSNICKISSVMEHHYARYHPEHFFRGMKAQLSGERNKQFQRILLDFLFPEFIQRVEEFSSCTLCGMKYQARKWCENNVLVRRHLALKHEKKLKARLDEILEDETLEKKLLNSKPDGMMCCPCGMYVPQWDTSKHKKLQCQLTVIIGADEARESVPNEIGDRDHPSNSNCTSCRFSCRDGISNVRKTMELHRVRYHPEHFFQKEKQQTSGMKSRQFQRILADFLFPAFVKKIGAIRSCTLCKKKYQNRYWYQNDVSARKHLIEKHKAELKKRLKNILEDESLEEKLESCRSDGVWCPCGVYLPSWVMLQTKHKQVHCKLNGTECRDSGVMEKGSSEVQRNYFEGTTQVHSTQLSSAISSDLANSSSEIDVKQENPAAMEISPDCSPNQTPFEIDDPLECESVLPHDHDQHSSSFSMKCTYCDYMFTSGTDTRAKRNPMEMHFVKYHPEHYFAEERDKASGLGLNDEVFQKLLCFLWQQFIRNFECSGRRIRLCVLCESSDKKFYDFRASSSDLRIIKHLILEHEEKLKKTLQEILDDISRGSKLSRYLPKTREQIT